ncbi:MAG: hypothetical protein ABH846_02085 [Patescibacteria group bacterium]
MSELTSGLLLLIYSAISLAMAFFLFTTGKAMTRLQSLENSLNQYLKNSKKATWIEKYVYGWAFWGGKATKMMVEAFGDKFITVWYKISGYIFYVFAFFFLFGVIVNWLIFLNVFN